jgi:hypothetical protein
MTDDRGQMTAPPRADGFNIQGSRFKIDEIVKSARSVIPGLTRNPELIEITGFPLSRE